MFRRHGVKQFTSIFVHGGPGAAGDLYDMCEVLSKDYGILETLHKGLSVDEQVEEIEYAVEHSDRDRITLVGHSWGAWLVVYYAAKYPEKVKRLLLISSGPFEEKYLSKMNSIRNERFEEEDLLKLREYFQKMNESTGEEADGYFQEAGNLFHKTDSYDEIKVDMGDKVSVKKEIYEKVWGEAAEMRKNGELMNALKTISCPVTVIHGDYDPHPYEGVKNPLLESGKSADFYLLQDCGHSPWREKAAKDEFYHIMQLILK